jgi:hypothetical protein
VLAHRTAYYGSGSRAFAVAELAVAAIALVGGLLNLPFNT